VTIPLFQRPKCSVVTGVQKCPVLQRLSRVVVPTASNRSWVPTAVVGVVVAVVGAWFQL
jgi:hypothetical protein